MTYLPVSFLYVPGDRPELLEKARQSGAGAIILDLEDGVAQQHHATARENVRAILHQAPTEADGPQLWVRLGEVDLEEDLLAASGPRLAGIILAKCTSPLLERVDNVLQGDDPDRSIPVVGLIESAEAMVSLAEITHHRRLHALGMGEADLKADLRMASDAGQHLDPLRQQVVLHSAAAGLHAPVAATSIDIRDLKSFATTTQHLRDLGFRSRTAIHPAQVGIINETMSPSAEEIVAAHDLLDRLAAAPTGIAVDAGGKMIDEAVARTAREITARASRAKGLR